ncbi:Tetratricopeptide repeat-containing protein [Pseudogulbenkiania subflava DSM 22618]|uniref:Tetratricopeptide repeat-containing protein n=2 Tax=Pseudogulbenkiania subflava TaxID=451637 RepID=A0A1Y6BJB9_9NEIS|nr:Tetratricopeptide repeat-containing protein [Pseudogulbenkiania subflava DSM 22618]
MKTKHLTLPLLCLVPLLQSCESTPPKQAWEMQPLMRVSNSNDSPAAYYQLGRYYQGQNRTDKAIPAFQKALALDSQYAEAHNALGALYAAQGRYDMAIAEFQNALATSPSSPHFLNNLGYTFYLQGRYAEAAAIYEKAVALNPSDLKIVNNRNLTMAKLGGREQTKPATLLAGTPQAAQAPAAETSVGAATEKVVDPKQQENVVAVATPLPSAPPPTSSPVPFTTAEGHSVQKTAIEPPGTDRHASQQEKNAPAAVLALKETTQATMTHPLPRFEVSNGNGVTGMAKRVGYVLANQGFAKARLTNQKPFQQSVTLVEYRQGFAPEAERLSASLPVKPMIKEKNDLRTSTDIRLVLGKDVMRNVALVTPRQQPTRLALK